MSKLTIGLFGFGCVGQGLYNILERSQHESIGVKDRCKKSGERSAVAATEIFFSS